MKSNVLIGMLLLLPSLAQGGATMILQPVPPKTVPPSNYAPGTTIVGQEIILSSVPARVWLEVHVTGWGPVCAATVQARIDATDVMQDGGGYAGSGADCNGVPANGGDLIRAIAPCAVTLDCRASVSGRIGLCGGGEPVACVAGFCSDRFQDKCDDEWIGGQLPPLGTPPMETIGPNARFGETIDPSFGCLIEFFPSYLGTLVVDVPADAKGSYRIDFNSNESFMAGPGGAPIGISEFRSGTITAPCGRCCSGYIAGQIGCEDHVGLAECANAEDQVFSDGELCPSAGGPACPKCASDSNCVDELSCTFDRCEVDHACSHTPVNAICSDGVFCNGAELCDPASGGCIPGPIPCDPSFCHEAASECGAGIPAVSNWGVVILILALLIAAKLRYAYFPRKS